MKYKIVCDYPSYSERKIESLIEQGSTPDEIDALLKRNLFSIERLEIPCGSLRMEHIQKALKIAEYFGTSKVLPNIPLLKKLSVKWIALSGIECNLKNIGAIQYYKDTYHDLDLNDKELKEIVQKLSIEDFISIDVMAERAVLIWNSIPGVKTTNSCTGHGDALRYFCFSNFNFTIDANTYPESVLEDVISNRFIEFNSDIFKTEIKINKETVCVRFFQIPPHEWITQNKLITVEELTQKCYEQLKSTFRTNGDLNNFEHEKKASSAGVADYIHNKLYKYFNRLNSNFDINEQEDVSFWGVFRKRCLVFEETYKEFYLSQDAVSNIKKFWKCCEEVGMKVRKMKLKQFS